jgi:hypothetical protein
VDKLCGRIKNISLQVKSGQRNMMHLLKEGRVKKLERSIKKKLLKKAKTLMVISKMSTNEKK